MFRSISSSLRHVSKSSFLKDGFCPSTQFSKSLTMSTEQSGASGGTPSVTRDSVIHDTDQNEFYIQLKDGSHDGRAYLQYSHIKADYVDLEHTVVPVEFRGHGIAKVLAETVFDYFVEKNVMFRPTCTYLQKFYNENQLPQYTEKVKWD